MGIEGCHSVEDFAANVLIVTNLRAERISNERSGGEAYSPWRSEEEHEEHRRDKRQHD